MSCQTNADDMATAPPDLDAAQSTPEQRSFVEAFARVRLLEIIATLTANPPAGAAADAEHDIHPDWKDEAKLRASGLTHDDVSAECRLGSVYLHIDVAVGSRAARQAFLEMSGLSDKQKRDLYPRLSAARLTDDAIVRAELASLNAHLRWVSSLGARTELFTTYQRAVGLHGRTQNTSGKVGAMGAALAFIDAIRTLDPSAIVDLDGSPPEWPLGNLPPSPEQVFEWQQARPDCTVRAILLRNGRALVFSSSKDANIFQSLSTPYGTAAEARLAYKEVRNDQQARHQRMHEFAVGEVKTAADSSNLHERVGLASRETQTELRTDRFLMMALLTPSLLTGGVANRVMNNRDLVRFSHIFNLHHCWGWDGGRGRHPAHWNSFCEAVRVWCGL